MQQEEYYKLVVLERLTHDVDTVRKMAKIGLQKLGGGKVLGSQLAKKQGFERVIEDTDKELAKYEKVKNKIIDKGIPELEFSSSKQKEDAKD